MAVDSKMEPWLNSLKEVVRKIREDGSREVLDALETKNLSDSSELIDHVDAWVQGGNISKTQGSDVILALMIIDETIFPIDFDANGAPQNMSIRRVN